MATQTPTIVIPDELRPSDGRFGSGPSKVRPEAVAALAEAAGTYLGTSHRQDGVRSMVGRVRSGLRELFALPDGYEVVLGDGGATLMFDAVAYSLVDRRSRHYVFGEFSAKFAAAVRAAPHLEDPDVVEAEPGTHPDAVPSDEVDVYAMTHNETSTGVMMPVRRPSPGPLTVVDATSAAGGMPVDPAAFDVYFFSPQKCFAADAGIWVALCSPAALERVQRVTATRAVPEILDLAVAAGNAVKDQTLNTPPLAGLFLFVHTIEWMLANGGLDWAVARCERSAQVVYGWAERTAYTTPFVAVPAQRSATVATVDFVDVDALEVARVLRANGIVDVEPYRKLGRNQLRIAMFPAIEPSDLERLTGAIDFVAGKLGGGG